MDPFMKNWFKFLSVISLLINATSITAYAINAKQGYDSANDMLQDTNYSEDENENADAVSKWGKTANRARAEAEGEARPLAAIDESSFSYEKNRAPASMREPAAAKPAAEKPLPTANTMKRTLREKKAYQEAALIVNDLGFFPSTLFVTQGIPVRLFVTGASKNSQCIIMDSFGVRRQVRSNKVEEVTFTPDQIGKFSFSCPMSGAKGTMVVKELEVFDRFPASESMDTSMMRAPAKNEGKAESLINDSDFGIEFRVKR